MGILELMAIVLAVAAFIGGVLGMVLGIVLTPFRLLFGRRKKPAALKPHDPLSSVKHSEESTSVNVGVSFNPTTIVGGMPVIPHSPMVSDPRYAAWVAAQEQRSYSPQGYNLTEADIPPAVLEQIERRIEERVVAKILKGVNASKVTIIDPTDSDQILHSEPGPVRRNPARIGKRT